MIEYELRYGVLLDGVDVTDHLRSVSWDFRQSAPFSSFDLEFTDPDLFEQCSPEIDRGEARITVQIDGHEWESLIEQRSRSTELTGATFRVSGRDPAAVLDEPHAQPVDYAVSTDTTAHTIVAALAAPFTVSWEIEDWPIFEGTFSASLSTPFAIIQQIVQHARAFVRYDPDSKVLRVKRKLWDLSGAASTATLSSADHVEKVSPEEIRHGNGMNRVRVLGGAASDGSIDLEAVPIEGYPGEFYVVAHAYPMTKLSELQFQATDGTWVTAGNGRDGQPLGKVLAESVADEEWNFAGPSIEARYPVMYGTHSVSWLNSSPDSITVERDGKLVTLASPTETQKWMQLGIAHYTTRRTRFMLTGCTESRVKIQAYYGE